LEFVGHAHRLPILFDRNFPLDPISQIHNHTVVDYLSATFAALSDPTRRSIVSRLTAGPATVMELAAPFSISQQAISKHLAYLENARLIERQRDGRQNFCAIKPDTIREVADWAEGYRRIWEANFQRLDSLLAEMKSEKELSSKSAKPKKTKRT
jgi:DNA-binding transcriptional ArsR family regulator